MPHIDGLIRRRRIIADFRVRRADADFDITGIDVRALIDTGASVSGISPKVVRALNLPLKSKAPLGSVRGEEQVPRYLFGLGVVSAVGDDGRAAPFFFDDVIGFEFRDDHWLDALIGMDILEQCDLTITRPGSWTLRFGR